MTRLGNQKFYLAGRKVHLKGKGVTDILLDGGKGPEEMKAVNGSGLTEAALRRLQELRPKAISVVKRANIRFSV